MKGVAEYTYPHPSGWTLKELDSELPLDALTVSALTKAFVNKLSVEPTCMEAWTDITSSWHVNCKIDWDQFGELFTCPLATNKDLHLFFKHILHRRLIVRAFFPTDDGYNKCRCCNMTRETQAHLHRCSTLWPVWKEFRRLVSTLWRAVAHSPELTFLGMTSKGEFLPIALRVLHAIMWRMTIIEFTRTGLEDKIFSTKHIFTFALRRLQMLMNAQIYFYKRARAKALRHERTPPKK